MPEERTVTVPLKYLKQLEKKVESLKPFLEISPIIASTLDFNDLMTLVMDKAKLLMDADACSILLVNKDTNKLEFEVALGLESSANEILKKKISLEMDQGIAGWVATHMKPLIIKDAKTDPRFCKDIDKKTGFVTNNLLAVPLIGRSGLIGVVEIVNFKNRGFDIEIMLNLSKQFAIAIENAIFYKESIERERLKQEFEIAATIQRSFLPESPTLCKGNLTVSAINISAKYVGGDIYDFIQPSAEKLGVFIGDVSGKGVSAALYMAKIISDLRYIAHAVDSPDIALSSLNTHLCKANAPRGMFLTAIYMLADTIKGNVSVSVAGHPPFLWLKKDEVRVMDIPSGPPLGIMAMEYPFTRIELEEGDRLLLLTDGAFDAKNKSGERLGFEDVVDFVKRYRDEDSIIQKLVDYISDFSKGMDRADDLTIVELKYGS